MRMDSTNSGVEVRSRSLRCGLVALLICLSTQSDCPANSGPLTARCKAVELIFRSNDPLKLASGKNGPGLARWSIGEGLRVLGAPTRKLRPESPRVSAYDLDVAATRFQVGIQGQAEVERANLAGIDLDRNFVVRSIVGWISEVEILFNVIDKPIQTIGGSARFGSVEQAVAILNVSTGEVTLLTKPESKLEALLFVPNTDERLVLVQSGLAPIASFGVLNIDDPSSAVGLTEGYVTTTSEWRDQLVLAAKGAKSGIAEIFSVGREGLRKIADIPAVGDGRSRTLRISLSIDPESRDLLIASEVPPLNLDRNTKVVSVSRFTDKGYRRVSDVKFRAPQLRPNSLALMKTIVTTNGLLITDEGWFGLVSRGRGVTVKKSGFFAPDDLRCG
jgi:hypothetical protein